MDIIASSVEDAARQIGVSRATIYRLIDQGQLRKVKIGRKTLIPQEGLRALIATGVAEAA